MDSKLHKVNRETLKRIQTDHDHFLEAFEKPTRIYRFLKARHAIKPLFLHRNLSYMRTHRKTKPKLTKKFSLDKLINHTRTAKQDFTSEIKSDNHLKISFSGLEAGIDYNTLLEKSYEQKPIPAQNGIKPQLVEIEVLLYSFSQPSVEALISGNNSSVHTSCTSLGKRVINFSNHGGETRGRKKSLSIPESTLTWKRRQPGATQMIVFRATEYKVDTQCPKPSKKRGRKIKNRRACPSTPSPVASSPSECQETVNVMADSKPPASVDRSYHNGHKPVMKDASVMTDLSFGTDVVSELAEIYDNRCTENSPPPQNGRSIHQRADDFSLTQSRQDKCTSPLIPKLALRNGVLHNYMTLNGYADPSITALRHKGSRTLSKNSLSLKNKPCLLNGSSSQNVVYSETMNDTNLNAARDSLLVSFPRSYFEKTPADEISEAVKATRKHKKRPSEVQKLMGGLSEDQVPKFTAEDVSSWSTVDKSHWLGSSTRKVNPVDYYSAYPYSRPVMTSPISQKKRIFSNDSEISEPPHKCSRLSTPVDSSLKDPFSPVDSLETHSLSYRVDTPDHSEHYIQSSEVFSGQLAVLDSRGDCLLGEGEYKVMLNKCLANGETRVSDVDFEPLSWSSVFSGGKMSQDGNKSRNLLLHFNVNWTNGPPKHQLLSTLDTALDLKLIRDSYYPPSDPQPLNPDPQPLNHDLQPLNHDPLPLTLPQPSIIDLPARHATPSLESTKDRIVFNFIYANNSLQQTESKCDVCCPWCSINCVELYSLLKHLSLCHPRLQFTYSPSTDKSLMISVHINKLYDTCSSIERDPGERNSLVPLRQRPAKALPCTCVLVDKSSGVRVQTGLSEFLNDGSWKRGYNTNRVYHHSNSCLPMLKDEISSDSEEEESTLEWQKICYSKMLDEFTDVNKGEKRLMKLWNIFVVRHRLMAQRQMSLAALIFVQQYKEQLLAERIDRNFLSHLLSLYDFGLITPQDIKQCMSAMYS